MTMSAGTNSGGSWTWPSAGGECSPRWAPAVSWLVAQRWCWAPSLGGLGKGASSLEGASRGAEGREEGHGITDQRDRKAGRPGVGGGGRE